MWISQVLEELECSCPSYPQEASNEHVPLLHCHLPHAVCEIQSVLRSTALCKHLLLFAGAASSSTEEAVGVAQAQDVQSEADRKRAQMRLQRQQKAQSLHLSSLRKQWAAEHADRLQNRQQAHQEFVKQNAARSLAKQAERTKDAAKGQRAMKAAQGVAAQRKVFHYPHC